MTAMLDAAIDTLRGLDNSDDVRWLVEFVYQQQGGRPRMHGVSGGFEGYPLSSALAEARDLAGQLEKGELETFLRVVELVYALLRPRAGEGVGQVDIKTMVRSYPQIDFKTGLPELDADGLPVMMDFAYSYCYIRQYASKGDKTRSKPRLLSIYADRGMGKGGTGGYVAAALREGIVTEREILDAWHAGEEAYGAFIDECKARMYPGASGERE